jgi:hypothetical protein
MDVLSFCDGFNTHHIGTLRCRQEGASTPSTESPKYPKYPQPTVDFIDKNRLRPPADPQPTPSKTAYLDPADADRLPLDPAGPLHLDPHRRPVNPSDDEVNPPIRRQPKKRIWDVTCSLLSPTV